MPTTSTWYGAIGQTAQDRLLAAWPDAPIENEETLGFLLSVARDQVLAFAPTAIAPQNWGTAPLDRYVYAQLQQAQNFVGRTATLRDAKHGRVELKPKVEMSHQ